jgi:transcriptional regulator with XRE-family HTH domain
MYDLLQVLLFGQLRCVNNIRNEAYLKAFGKHIRQLREERGLTMENLAFDAGIEYRQLGRIERGEVNTTISTVLAISTALVLKSASFSNLRVRNKNPGERCQGY